MPIMITIPDECKSLAEAVRDLVTAVERAVQRNTGGRAVDYAQVEREIGARTAAIERATHERLLAALDVDAPAVVIEGQVHTRVHRVEGRYYTLAGDVVARRSLYRARRNGKVVDAISLRTGALDGGWLPETAGRHGRSCCSRAPRARRSDGAAARPALRPCSNGTSRLLTAEVMPARNLC